MNTSRVRRSKNPLFGVPNRPLTHKVIDAVITESDCVQPLRDLFESDEGSHYPEEWLSKSIEAIENDDFSILKDLFIQERFLGVDDDLIIVAPFTTHRGGVANTRLSAVAGRVMPHMDYHQHLKPAIHSIFGSPPRQVVPRVLPVAIWATGGHLAGESGEAFITADGWQFDAYAGPALNNMTEQSSRVFNGAQKALYRIFESQSADFLLEPWVTESSRLRIQQIEYQFHDAGHATGIGLFDKLATNTLPGNAFDRGIEEWRADGVAHAIGRKVLSKSDLSAMLRSNMSLRFGLDAHRNGGVDRDQDINCTLLALNGLWESGQVMIRDGKLALRDLSDDGIIRAQELNMQNAVRLTQAELTLNDIAGLDRLNLSMIQLNRVFEDIFDHFVRQPCQNLFLELS